MNNISDMSPEGLPSSMQLIKATAIALLIGAVVLLTAVLPAEYGVDPTGLGERIGLTALSTADAAEPEETNLLFAAAPSVSSLWKSSAPYRTDSLSVTLQPNQGSEIKAVMSEGERLVFSWEVKGGNVSFDMHGEPPGNGDEFTSYWKGVNQSSAHGEFVAPFEGTHGWYWLNRGPDPVTVTVSTSGFYEKLYQPE